MVGVRYLKFLNGLINYEKTPRYNYRLEPFIGFLKRLGSPEKRLKNVIHIAGTKGKGSTAAILDACLQECGYRVGLFSSPHLARVNERIKVNHQEIPDARLQRYIDRIRGIGRQSGKQTYFEVLTAAAYLYFTEEQTDFSLLETGLGGRLDTTNVTVPLISVITRVGYDHTELLGDDLKKIAREKAGIMKPHTPVITTAHQPAAVRQILQRKADTEKSPLVFAEELHRSRIIEQTFEGTTLHISGAFGSFTTLLPLVGVHQTENLVIALAVLSVLRSMGFGIPASAVEKGIAKTSLRGRLEVIKKNPLVIFDCAHNEDSFRALHKTIHDLNFKNFSLIFGANKDKDISYCLKYIFPEAREVLLVKPRSVRALEPYEIYIMAKRYQKRLFIAHSIENSIKYIRNVSKNNKILITGSFYLWDERLTGL